jgi:hypothetical protein
VPETQEVFRRRPEKSTAQPCRGIRPKSCALVNPFMICPRGGEQPADDHQVSLWSRPSNGACITKAKSRQAPRNWVPYGTSSAAPHGIAAVNAKVARRFLLGLCGSALAIAIGQAPGRRAASPPASRRRAPARSADEPSRRGSTLTRGGLGGGPGVDTHEGRSWWGGPGGCVTRHVLP